MVSCACVALLVKQLLVLSSLSTVCNHSHTDRMPHCLQGGKATNKEAVLLSLASRAFAGGSTIIFFATKQATHRMHLLFRLCGLAASAELHGNLTQAQRLQSLELFRQVHSLQDLTWALPM